MTRRLRIVIVTQYYDPDPPSWIPTGLARELTKRGHDVRVLTTYPHYETGRVSHGYRQRLRHTERDGAIPVRRVPIVASHSQNAIGRVANYISFAISTRLSRSFVRGADVAYVYATPMTAAEGPRVWSRSLRIPYVLHVQDLWPESVTGSGLLPGRLNSIAESALSGWLGTLYDRAAATIAIAPSMRTMLIERGVRHETCHTVLNWSNDADEAVPSRSERPSVSQGGMAVVYAGNLGRMQDLATVVRAAYEARDLHGFRLQIAGSGVLENELKRLADQLGARNIDFLGRLAPHEMTDLYNSADYQVVPLRNLDIFTGTIPSKFQAGLANGLPVIASVHGDVSDIVKSARVGFTAEPESWEALEAAFRRAYATTTEERDAMSIRAREFYEANMSKRAAVSRIEAILHSVAG